nr:aminotransferase class I/II-fold pyridoxal phosphate-dependent enzyme [Sphingomicrobium nitratireducens]
MQVSVFERMSLAAAKHGATNLGQGFPDFGWPDAILEEAARAVTQGSNQYPPSRGLPALREAVAAHYNAKHDLALTAEHVVVTSGATEALAAMIFSLVEPGDEVIVFTPAFDAYEPMIRRAGGVPVEVRLEGPDFRIAREAIEAKVTARTRAVLFNNPHNPTGRLFDRDELDAIAAVAEARDLCVISDEVWEEILLDGQDFVPFSSLPGMAARTFKCGSAGKIFSLTGWKVGWMIAPPGEAAVAAKAHQFLTFATPPNLQAAVAKGLSHPEWLQPMRDGFARARDRILAGLEAAGYAAIAPAATYFMVVDLAASGIAMDDEAFARLAVEEAGVAVVPMSPFYFDDAPRNLVRLCFAKRDATIDAGLDGLVRAKGLAR